MALNLKGAGGRDAYGCKVRWFLRKIEREGNTECVPSRGTVTISGETREPVSYRGLMISWFLTRDMAHWYVACSAGRHSWQGRGVRGGGGGAG